MMTRKEKEPAYVGQCRSVFGRLSLDTLSRLEAVIRSPSEETWENAYTIIINPDRFTTLWNAWVAVDPDAPRTKQVDKPWLRVPDQLTLYRAIRCATERQLKGTP